MPSPIDQLFALQTVDVQLRALRLELGALEGAAAEVRAEVSTKRTSTGSKRDEVAELERRRKELETRLSEEETKTQDRRMRMQRIKNEKELAALRREVDLGKAMSLHLEEELLKLLEGAESQVGELKTMEEELTVRESVLTEREAEHAARTREVAQELERLTAERGALADRLDEDVRKRYELVFERKGGLAVVEVRKEGDCGGCRVRVPPQLVTQIHRRDVLVTCPSCHRMLYVASSAPSPAPTRSA